MHPLEKYLESLKEVRRFGVPETSGYGTLETLFNEIGKSLNPRVRCVINIANKGAGIPDGGLFTAEQFRDTQAEQIFANQLPVRGAIEVKSTKDDVRKIALTEQVTKYLNKYGQVLVTNYYEFLLVGKDRVGNPVLLEAYQLMPDEASFWTATAKPESLAKTQGERFTEYLKRVMLYNAPIASPADVARFLASYARDALARIEQADLSALQALQQALEKALGITFTEERGRHFFRSTLIQTLFYGVFSAWVLWCKERPMSDSEHFNWRNAEWSLHVPFIRSLFHQINDPSRLRQLGLVEVLDWTGALLNRVDRANFFARFEEDHAVQYFYEPFLREFDPGLRKSLGVWYTPPEIVRYMVARVDTVLREELGLPDGLANENVYVLDPCCGTGAYLVEVLKHINATPQANGDALSAGDVKQAALKRVFGFEILPAPFVVAHLQLGLLLQNLGVPLTENDTERAGIYLTNALTGWEQGEQQVPLPGFPELQREAEDAANVKRKKPILVILGNPPYDGFAGVAIKEERALSTAYRKTKHAPAPQGQGLNDLYVRFYRMAERRIVEETHQGVVCFISNYSWLDGLSFTGMRERYLEVFDRIWIDCLNGDKYKTGKLTPEGESDPSVFSTDFNSEGIQVGTAISLMVRKPQHQGVDALQFRHLWGKTKRARLLESVSQNIQALYQNEHPALDIGLPFMPALVSSEYFTWPKLTEIFPISFPGVKTSRDDVVVDIDKERLIERMKQYFDPTISHEEMEHISPGAMEDASRFEAIKTRNYLLKRGFLSQNLVRYHYRPFDRRWIYWEAETKLLDEKRPEYFPQVFDGNIWIAAAQRHRHDFDPPMTLANLTSLHIIERGANLFPLYLKKDKAQLGLFDQLADGTKPVPLLNLSDAINTYASEIESPPTQIFYHTVATMHALCYRTENAGALQQDWPRIPLPDNAEQLRASAHLGMQIAALLDTEQLHIKEVTENPLRPEMRIIGSISHVEEQPLDIAKGDLAVTANWGYGGSGSPVMPGRGKAIKREYTPDERATIEAGVAGLGLSDESALALLGETTYDIYLNDVAYWRNVPARVWEYTIGGYQVIKKWLSYRERGVLGRDLTADEAREVMQMARRIAAILLLEPQLDKNYREVVANTYTWPR